MSNVQFVFKVTALSVAGFVLVGVGVGQLLADRWTVATTRVLRAKSDRVMAAIGDLAGWQDWYAAQVDLGNPTRCEVLGTAGTVGHALRWSGPRGEASLTLQKVTVGADGAGAIDYDYGTMAANGGPANRGTGRVMFAPSGDGCSVTWIDGGVWDGLMGRWWGWFGALQDRCKQIQISTLEGLQQHLEPPGPGASK